MAVMNIAHRGASAYMPENTIVAFEKAIILGADAMELDVRLSKDKNLVVIHDDSVDRTTDGKGLVSELTLKELKELDAGSWFSKEFSGERIPTIEEVFKKFANRIRFCIEIKALGVEETLVNLIKKYRIVKKTIITSFKYAGIKRIKALDPEIEVGFLTQSVNNAIINDIFLIKAERICLPAAYINSEIVQLIHGNNLKLQAFAVRPDEEIDRMVCLGIDAMTVNDPARLKDALFKI